jgi:hypothetical protein
MELNNRNIRFEREKSRERMLQKGAASGKVESRAHLK